MVTATAPVNILRYTEEQLQRSSENCKVTTEVAKYVLDLGYGVERRPTMKHNHFIVIRGEPPQDPICEIQCGGEEKQLWWLYYTNKMPREEALLLAQAVRVKFEVERLLPVHRSEFRHP